MVERKVEEPSRLEHLQRKLRGVIPFQLWIKADRQRLKFTAAMRTIKVV